MRGRVRAVCQIDVAGAPISIYAVAHQVRLAPWPLGHCANARRCSAREINCRLRITWQRSLPCFQRPAPIAPFRKQSKKAVNHGANASLTPVSEGATEVSRGLGVKSRTGRIRSRCRTSDLPQYLHRLLLLRCSLYSDVLRWRLSTMSTGRDSTDW